MSFRCNHLSALFRDSTLLDDWKSSILVAGALFNQNDGWSRPMESMETVGATDKAWEMAVRSMEARATTEDVVDIIVENARGGLGNDRSRKRSRSRSRNRHWDSNGLRSWSRNRHWDSNGLRSGGRNRHWDSNGLNSRLRDGLGSNRCDSTNAVASDDAVALVVGDVPDGVGNAVSIGEAKNGHVSL